MNVSDRLLTVSVCPAADWPAVQDSWSKLNEASPYGCYFLRPAWIGSWIETYGEYLDIEIVRFSSGDRLVGACLLVWRTQRRGLVGIRTAYLNASGEDEWEEVGTEFNDLLCLAGWEKQVAAELRRYLDRHGWDDLVMNGCRRSAAIAALRAAFAGCEERVRTVPSRYVDLDAIRKSGEPFETSLSSNTRYYIRQSIKLYEQSSVLRVHRAESVAEAAAMLGALARLHQERWTKKGCGGAFASPRFRRFHDAILSRCFAKGEVDIVRVSAGDETIGIIYNLVGDGRAYFYQCGFQFSENKKLRPGLVTLQKALQWYADTGLPEFNLMAGDRQYKRSLAKSQHPLDWWTVSSPTWRNLALDVLRRVRRSAQALRESAKATPREAPQVRENAGRR
jgi:CelD/BcsL family acetyltransferase involved in cellulose biosynthesis